MAEEAPLEPESGRFPVFVDDTGRRHRWLRIAGWCIGVLAASYVGLFVLSLASSPTLLPLSIPGVGRILPNAGAPDIGVPGRGHSKISAVVATSTPAPAAASGPSAAPSTVSTPEPVPALIPPPGKRPSSHPTPAPHPTGQPSAAHTPHGSPTAHPTARGTGKPTAHPTNGHGHSATPRPQHGHQ